MINDLVFPIKIFRLKSDLGSWSHFYDFNPCCPWKISNSKILIIFLRSSWKWKVLLFPFILDRSSCPEVFYKISVLKSFAKFTGKHLWHSILFNEVADRRAATLLKKILEQVFSCQFWKNFKYAFFIEHLQWLFLARNFYFLSSNTNRKSKNSHNSTLKRN